MAISRTDLVNRIAEKKRYHKYQIKNIMDDIFAEITEVLNEGDKVAIRGFGTFEVKTYKSHPAVHPGTKEPITVPEYRNVAFRPGEELTRTVRGN